MVDAPAIDPLAPALTTNAGHNRTRQDPIQADVHEAWPQVNDCPRRLGRTLQAEGLSRLSNQVSNNGCHREWTSGDAGGRYIARQGRRGGARRPVNLASGRRGQPLTLSVKDAQHDCAAAEPMLDDRNGPRRVT